MGQVSPKMFPAPMAVGQSQAQNIVAPAQQAQQAPGNNFMPLWTMNQQAAPQQPAAQTPLVANPMLQRWPNNYGNPFGGPSTL